jgi:hypothetical protein
MRFVDRGAELERLNRLPAPGLGVLWGRRRVGKTRLLVEWCQARGGLYTVADQSSEAIQRSYFAQAVASRVPGFADVVYPDWRALFGALAREVRRGGLKGPIIFDEVPYLVAACPPLASTLQAFVDHEGRDAGALLVLAGSIQHMMQGLVLDASTPLYGRAQAAFEVTPLTPGFIGEALGLPSAVDAVRAYAVWGGIPWYWELAQPFGAGLDDAVASLVLDPAGPLHHEPDRLLAEEQPAATVLRPMLDAIGAGAHRLSEIAGRVGQPATSLSRPLSRLVALGLVGRELPFGDAERGGKRALYRITDPFLRLWFRVVASRRGLLVASPPQVRRQLWEQARAALFAEAWEDLCRRAVPHLTVPRGRRPPPGPFGPAARYWRGKDREWDVIAQSADGASLLVGECKWTERPVSDAALDRLARELASKGAPDVADARGRSVVRALFVPRVQRKGGRRPADCLVFDAEDVIGALR